MVPLASRTGPTKAPNRFTFFPVNLLMPSLRPRSGRSFSAPSSARSWCSARSATAWHLRVGFEREHTGGHDRCDCRFSCNLALCSWNVLARVGFFPTSNQKRQHRVCAVGLAVVAFLARGRSER
jgi:hypothetical protein